MTIADFFAGACVAGWSFDGAGCCWANAGAAGNKVASAVAAANVRFNGRPLLANGRAARADVILLHGERGMK
jgi:hypothetical protein